MESKKKERVISNDKKSGSLAYNRLDMQISQTLHMAIELYPTLDYLFVLDYYDDISIFDHESNPTAVSYYQLKTSEESISISTALSEDWIAKMHHHLEDPQWLVTELGLITNCPLRITSTFEDERGKKKNHTDSYTAERTPFNQFNANTITAIKKDIAEKMHISEADIDLSKFVHMRTTLSIPKHNEIVEQEVNDFLRNKHPKITLELAKTIFTTMMELLHKRQSYELLGDNEPFEEVRKKKGFSRNDLNRIIDKTLTLAVPPFSEIQDHMNYRGNAIYKASFEYSRIIEDIQNQQESFLSLFEKLYTSILENPINEDEALLKYTDRIVSLNSGKRAAYSKEYKEVLVACIQINEWRK